MVSSNYRVMSAFDLQNKNDNLNYEISDLYIILSYYLRFITWYNEINNLSRYKHDVDQQFTLCHINLFYLICLRQVALFMDEEGWSAQANQNRWYHLQQATNLSYIP